MMNSVAVASHIKKSSEKPSPLGDASGQPVMVVTGIRGDILFWNRPAEQFLGYRTGEMTCRNVIAAVMPDGPGRIWRRILLGLTKRGSWTGELALRQRSGRLVRVEATVSRLSRISGAPSLLVCVDREADAPGRTASFPLELEDVDRRPEHGAPLEPGAVSEYHHRFRANLQVVSSLLSLQAKRVNEMFKDTQNRIRSMAIVHENLSGFRAGTSIDLAAYVRSLLDHLVASYAVEARDIKMEAQLADIRLDPERASSVGLILNELISNALKHAFPDRAAGIIRVRSAMLDARHVLLAVEDNGVGLPLGIDVTAVGSLGLGLVSGQVAQLGGRIALESGSGSAITITFPLEPGTGRREAKS